MSVDDPSPTLLLDSNLLIYAGASRHATSLRAWLASVKTPAASSISYVEVFGYRGITPREEQALRTAFRRIMLLPIDSATILEATRLRQQRSMSVGDAVIAGTALVHGLTLATHNTRDFAWIGGLQLIDPLVDPSAPAIS